MEVTNVQIFGGGAELALELVLSSALSALVESLALRTGLPPEVVVASALLRFAENLPSA